RVAGDARAERVPLVGAPHDRRRAAALFGRGEELEAAAVDVARERLAVDAADRAARVVVDHHLIGTSVLARAQEDAAVEAPFDLDLERDLEIAPRRVADEEPAIAWRVLCADDGAVLDAPQATRAMAARGAVRRGRARMPAGEAGAVEDRRRLGRGSASG